PCEHVAHSGRAQDADAVTEARPVDGPDLGDIDDARAWKSSFALPEAHVARHRSKPQVRRHCGDHGGRDGAAIEAVVLYDESGPVHCSEQVIGHGDRGLAKRHWYSSW